MCEKNVATSEKGGGEVSICLIRTGPFITLVFYFGTFFSWRIFLLRFPLFFLPLGGRIGQAGARELLLLDALLHAEWQGR